MFGIMVFVLQNNHSTWLSPAFLGMSGACLSMGSGEWFPSFVLPVYTAFVIDIIFLRHFYTFALPILFFIPSGGLARGRGLVGLSYKWGLNHNILWVKRTKQEVEHNLALTADPQVKQKGFRRTIILWGKNKLPKYPQRTED